MTLELRDAEHVGVTIEIGKGRTILGPHLTLKKSQLKIAAGANLLLGNSEFDRCTFEVQRSKRIFSSRSIFRRCRFVGRFSGIIFGQNDSEVLNCDFWAAELIDCDFQNCDIRKQRFAPWPQIVIPDGRSTARPLQQRLGKISPKLHLALEVLATSDPIFVGHATTAKQWHSKYKLPEAKLKKAIEALQDSWWE